MCNYLAIQCKASRESFLQQIFHIYILFIFFRILLSKHLFEVNQSTPCSLNTVQVLNKKGTVYHNILVPVKSASNLLPTHILPTHRHTLKHNYVKNLTFCQVINNNNIRNDWASPTLRPKCLDSLDVRGIRRQK